MTTRSRPITDGRVGDLTAPSDRTASARRKMTPAEEPLRAESRRATRAPCRDLVAWAIDAAEDRDWYLLPIEVVEVGRTPRDSPLVNRARRRTTPPVVNPRVFGQPLGHVGLTLVEKNPPCRGRRARANVPVKIESGPAASPAPAIPPLRISRPHSPSVEVWESPTHRIRTRDPIGAGRVLVTIRMLRSSGRTRRANDRAVTVHQREPRGGRKAGPRGDTDQRPH